MNKRKMDKFTDSFQYPLGYVIVNETNGKFVRDIVTTRDYLCRKPGVLYTDLLDDARVIPDDLVKKALRYLRLYYTRDE